MFRISLFVLILGSLNNVVLAQSPTPITDSYIHMENGEAVAYVAISDSTIISEIEIQIGCKGIPDNLYNRAYLFDQTSGLPSGISYLRNSLDVYLGLGIVSFPNAFEVKVRIKDTSGNHSSWFEYITN